MDLTRFLVSSANLGLLLTKVRMSPILVSLRRCGCGCDCDDAWFLEAVAVGAGTWGVRPRLLFVTTTEAANEKLLAVGSLILRVVRATLGGHGRAMPIPGVRR